MLYKGDFQRGKKHGKGEMYYASIHKPVKDNRYNSISQSNWHVDSSENSIQEHYKGDWRGNEKNGFGEMQYANGDFFKGEWREGMRNGTGEYTFKNNDSYNGNKSCLIL